jgi:hypothetical protein
MPRLLPALVLALLLASCGGDGGAADSDRSDLVGIVTEDVFAGDAAYREANLDKQATAGIGLVRQTFDWATIERVRGRYDFTLYDSWLEQLATKRMRVLGLIFGAPPFRSSAPVTGAERGTYPPRNPAAFGEFAAALAERYGPGGTFWQEHNDLPKFPIRAWQIWNEPSLPIYWPDGPNAAEYARLLAAASRALKHADPDAEVVSAGVPNSKQGVPFARYTRQLLAAGAADSFDTFGIHPYATDVEGVWRAVRMARLALNRHESRAPIWITEVGWATSGPQSPFTVGSQGQASRITQLFEEFPERRRQLGVRGLVYYNWKDSAPYAGGPDFFGLYTGLLNIDGAEKPGFLAFQRGAEALAD